MNYTIQAKAFQIIERLLNDGHTMSTLPIDTERARGILKMSEPATEDDLQALQLAVSDATAHYVP